MRQAQARFTEPETGELVVPGSIDHDLGAIILAAVRAGFALDELIEARVDQALAEACPRAQRYLGWPMLLVLRLRADEARAGCTKGDER